MDYERDETLTRRFAETGHGRALEVLYRRHLPKVYSLTRRYFQQREDAEEAASETFLRAFRALRERQYREEASFRTWLLRIAVNVCLERLRQPRLPTLSFEALPGDLFGYVPPGRSDLQDALTTLPDDQRLAVTLCDLEGYSAREAALVLNRSVTALKSLHYRARRALRDALEKGERDDV